MRPAREKKLGSILMLPVLIREIDSFSLAARAGEKIDS